MRKAVVHHLFRFASRGHAVARQFDGEKEADAANVGDERMAVLEIAHSQQRTRAQLARALEQVFVLDRLEGRQRRGAADRALLVRVVAERAIGGDIEVAPRDQRGHRKDGATQTLAEDDHVGDDVVVLEREHAARAPETDRHFVQDQ